MFDDQYKPEVFIFHSEDCIDNKLTAFFHKEKNHDILHQRLSDLYICKFALNFGK